MKIISTPYTHVHSFRALKRLHKAIIQNQVIHSDLAKMYQALLHFERYIDRLNRKDKKSRKVRMSKSSF